MTAPQPPHDEAAEAATLGALMLSVSQDLTGQILAAVSPGDFYNTSHQTIAATLVRLFEAQLPTDPITVAHHLGAGLHRLGGVQYLYDLVNLTPTVVSGPHYAAIVRRHAVLRDRQIAATRIQQLLASDDYDHDKLQQQLVELTQQVLVTDRGAIDTHISSELDWAGVLSADYTQLPFLTKPLLSPGAQISLVGDGKVGKSLFCMEWGLRLANGHGFLQSFTADPVRVGYVDLENSHDELQRRLWTTGYDRLDLLRGFHYQSFPKFGPLDTQQGASGLVGWVVARQLQVVFLDTISRMISGPENDSDTWLNLYRLALLPLKAIGVSVVRLDHFGKDRERGSRGSSAKTQDIDHEWVMTSTPAGLIQLKRTYTRNGIGDGLLMLRRLGNPQEPGTTAHVLYELPAQEELVLAQPEPPVFNPVIWDGQLLPADPKVAELVQVLDQLQIPENYGRERVARILSEERGMSAQSAKLGAALKWRRERQAAGQQVALEVLDALDNGGAHEGYIDDAR